MTKHLFENETIKGFMKLTTPYWNEGENVQDVAKAVLYLASSEATWLTGVALPVDGGFSAL
jgi:NAD(P)-dependent dehydrogenase (short-subunit alcohol dehydrogenase family)